MTPHTDLVKLAQRLERSTTQGNFNEVVMAAQAACKALRECAALRAEPAVQPEAPAVQPDAEHAAWCPAREPKCICKHLASSDPEGHRQAITDHEASQSTQAAGERQLHGFLLEDLSAIADGLDCYEKTVNVGNTTGAGDTLLQSTTAAAAAFIRAAILDTDRAARASEAARDVLAERQRQISVEGWTPKHDDGHGEGSMAIAAACYALAGLRGAKPYEFHSANLWRWTGWASSWFKPKDRRNNLVRSAALALAEIERLDRAARKAQGGK